MYAAENPYINETWEVEKSCVSKPIFRLSAVRILSIIFNYSYKVVPGEFQLAKQSQIVLPLFIWKIMAMVMLCWQRKLLTHMFQYPL